jgi:hypothetical protein
MGFLYLHFAGGIGREATPSFSGIKSSRRRSFGLNGCLRNKSSWRLRKSIDCAFNLSCCLKWKKWQIQWLFWLSLLPVSTPEHGYILITKIWDAPAKYIASSPVV